MEDWKTAAEHEHNLTSCGYIGAILSQKVLMDINHIGATLLLEVSPCGTHL